MKTLNQVIELIESMDSNELMNINNIYCDANGYDDYIYENDEEFLQMAFGSDVGKAIRAVSYGNYTYSHNFVKFDGYGNLESMYIITPNDLAETVNIIAQHILENPELYNLDLSDEN